PPKFTRTPVDQTGVSGGVASFICQATGDPRPKIVWNKKGKKVSNQRFEVIEFDDGSGSVLRIQPLRTPRDEAIYECVASNSVGEISVSTRLTVLREDQIPRGFPTIDMGPQLKVVERTRTATMLCAASGNPDPEITWFKDFLPVDTSNNNGRIKQLRSAFSDPLFGNVFYIHTGALQIELSEESDQGKYECVATNSAGTRYSAPANLYVRVRRVPPRFSIPPTNHEIMPGGSVNITCVAVGSPMPYVKWMLGAEDLTPEDDMPIGRNVLELNDVRQSANYTCVAMSTLGVIEAIAQITVKALPKPPGTPVVTESTATSITLTWDSGNPEPVSYYIIQHKPKNSEEPYKEIDGVATTRYSVAGLSPYSEYEFRVVAVNNIGRGPSSEPVSTRTSEQAPSSAPRNVQARMLSSTTILVQWEEPEEPNGQIQGYRVYYTMDPTQHVNSWMKHNVADSHITTIGNLVPQKTYSVKVLAFTSVGDGPLSSDIQVITQTGVPGQPLNFKAEPESETSILLSWTPPRSDTISSYELVYKDGEHGEEQRVSTEPTTSYRLQGLRPNSLYLFRLAARSPQGLGASTAEISARTMQSKPSAPPQDISCTSPSSTSILVSWKPPPVEKQNGIITAYSIKYIGIDGEDVKPHEILGISSDSTQYLLEQLEKWTEYRISVTAHTDVGPGPESLAVLIRTDEDVPSGPPRKVEVEAVNSTAVKVSWRSPVPSKQHGQIRGYQVHYVRMENGEPKGQPMLKDIMLADAQWEYDDTTEHEMIISGLQPETTYSFTVTAYTTKGDGARSKPKLVSTTGAVPGKPRLVISHTQMNTALIQWHPPVETFGPLQGYRLKFGRKDMDTLTTMEFSEKEDHFTATDIHKGASYVFRLSARNKVGFGEEMVKEISVPEEVPSGFPQNLHSESSTSTSVQLTWQMPLLAERNGIITKYTILYRDINVAYQPVELPVVPADTSMTLSGLKPDTTYDVKVRAHTSKGPGPYSPSVQFRTLPVDQAVFAKNFHVKAVMKTSVLLSWEIPENYNSALPFKILYDDGKMEVDGRATQKLITNLKPETSYSFVLTNRGNSAGGLQHRVTAKTAPDVLRTKPVFIGKTNLDGMITVELPEVPSNENIKGYYIVIVPLKRSRGKFIKPWESPDEMELDELLKEIARKRRSIRLGREVELKPYIAAHFEVLPTEFTLGDKKHYGGFENKQLQSGQEYVFFVLAVMEHSESTMYATSPYSDPVVSMDLDPQPITDEEEGLIWVVGPVLAVVFIICIVIAILLYKRKRAESDSRKSSIPNSKEVPSHHPTDPVELRRLNFQTPALSSNSVPYASLIGSVSSLSSQTTTQSLYDNNSLPRFARKGMASHPPIPILELADHIERLKANDNLKFSQEYESIDPGQQFTWEHSNLEVNKPKNRYANVIAYDHSRVLLSAIEGIPGSDYINANYIDGYRKQNAYIATQGALPETFGDFWRMMWEQQGATVVMMTKLEERSRVR
ncbi:PTPRD phosphatase, partial [Acrocephalus arundinaceus]|nr:PTPRD phosphatase [Acrocephalus arundinaceus]